MFVTQLGGDGVDSRLRTFQRNAGFQPADYQAVRVAPVVHPIGLLNLLRHRDGNKYFGSVNQLRPDKCRGRYSNNGVFQTADFHFLAGDIGVAPETALPAIEAEHGQGMAAPLYIVRGMQQAAPDGLDAQHVEEISGDLVTPQTGIPSAAAAQVHGYESVHRQAAQNGITVAIVFVIRIRERGELRLGSAHVDGHQLVLAFDTERPEDHRVDQRENCGVGADAKSQRHNRSGGKPGAGTKPPECTGQIVAQHRGLIGTLVAAESFRFSISLQYRVLDFGTNPLAFGHFAGQGTGVGRSLLGYPGSTLRREPEAAQTNSLEDWRGAGFSACAFS